MVIASVFSDRLVIIQLVLPRVLIVIIPWSWQWL